MKFFNGSKLNKFASIVLMLIFANTAVSEVKVTLVDGKKFSDYEVTGQSRSKSLKTLEKDLIKLFTEVSKNYVEENQILEIDVTNIDLPGIYHYSYGSSGRDIRIIDETTPYRIYFNFRVKSANGDLVKEGEYQLKEFLNLGLSHRKSRTRGTVSYYEKPLKKWFEKKFTS